MTPDATPIAVPGASPRALRLAAQVPEPRAAAASPSVRIRTTHDDADKTSSHGHRWRIFGGAERSLGPRFQPRNQPEQVAALLVPPATAIPKPSGVLEAGARPNRRWRKVGAVP